MQSVVSHLSPCGKFSKKWKIVSESICQWYTFSLIQINLFISVATFNFYPALITRKCGSIVNRICFIKDLLVATDQLPSNIAVTYFPYSFLCRISQISVHTTQKKNVSKYGRILFAFFVCVILNNTNLSER